MNDTVKLSKRLKHIASYLPRGTHFADIGSDHAYLPCYICLNDPTAKAIASEVKIGPFEISRQAISYFGLEHAVDVRYGNGFDVIESGEIDTAVIAGMGGILIASILDSGQAILADINCLLLQPNSHAGLVRQALAALAFEITNEDIVKDQGHFYEIIVANRTANPRSLSEKERMFGPVLMNQQNTTFQEKWEYEYTKVERAMYQMYRSNENNDDKIHAFKKKMCWIREVLDNGE